MQQELAASRRAYSSTTCYGTNWLCLVAAVLAPVAQLLGAAPTCLPMQVTAARHFFGLPGRRTYTVTALAT